MNINKNWILISLFNFFIASIMGLMLRGAFIWEFNWLDYRNLMHGHSHLAMLGWVYLALYILIGHFFLPINKWNKPIYTWLFWFTQITVLGMMFSFPIQGYGAVSITFSTLHIFASYFFCYLVWRDLNIKHPQITLLLKTALVLMLISTSGVWSLVLLSLSGGRGSALYQLAIQFYLHFQFHGWFTFSILALILSVLPKHFHFNRTIFLRFYALLLASVILTYGLIIEWGFGGTTSLVFNSIGVLFQFAALLLFLGLIRENRPSFFLKTSSIAKTFYGFGLLSWMIKVCIQCALLVPFVAVVSFTIRPFMIGFIHLTMLGFITGLLFAIIFGVAIEMERSIILQAGKYLFIIGFVGTEFLLFAQGIFYWAQWGQIPGFYELIFGASTLLPISVSVIILGIFKIPILKTNYKLITASY